MKSKNFAYKSAMVALATAAVLGFTACADDSSDNSPTTATETPASSSSVTESQIPAEGNDDIHCEALVPECGYTPAQLCAAGITEYCNANPGNTDTGNTNPGATDPNTPVSNTNPGEVQDPSSNDPSCTAAPVVYAQNDFNDIGTIYKGTQCNEKVIFVIRHGEREGFTGSVSALTEDGFDAVFQAGKKLVGPEKFRYVFSGMTRTYQTALAIAAGRGEVTYTTTYAEGEDGNEHFTVVSPEFKADTITTLKDGWYMKDKELRDQYKAADSIKNENNMYTMWAYDGKYADVFYDLEERSLELINNHILSDYASMPKFTLMASHDQVLTPLTIWASGKQIDLKLHEPTSRRWLNYAAGLAIIVNDKNEVRYAPVKTLDDKVLPDGSIISGGIQ